MLFWHPAGGPEEVEKYPSDIDVIYKEQIKHLFDCIENKKKPLVSIKDSIAVLEMIEAAKKSHRIGEKVTLA